MGKALIGTALYRYVWDGGSGILDRKELIGYCKEPPIEVLKSLVKTHCIHTYKVYYCAPIESYPSNIDGICIYPVYRKDMKGVTITGQLSDFEYELQGFIWDKYSKDGLKETIKTTKKIIKGFAKDNPYRVRYTEILRDYEAILEEV